MITEQRAKMECHLEILLAGIRWANNMLVEILSNYAREVNPQAAKLLQEATDKLAAADRCFRFGSEEK
jgi:hypothetical protein